LELVIAQYWECDQKYYLKSLNVKTIICSNVECVIHQGEKLVKRRFFLRRNAMENTEFVLRREEINLIHQCANTLSDKNSKLLFYNGIAGIGKTIFLRNADDSFLSLQNFVHTYVNLKEIENMPEEMILVKLRSKLIENHKIRFNLFDYAYFVYIKKSNPFFEPKLQSQNFLAQSNILLDLSILFPVIPTVIPTLFRSINLASKTNKLLIEFINHFSKELNTLNILEPYEILAKLPEYFSKDLSLYLSKNNKRAVFFLDSYESFSNNYQDSDSMTNREKLLFDKKIGLFYFLINTLFVICGRDQNVWMKTDKKLQNVSQVRMLKELSKEESEFLLNKIPDKRIRDRILELTKGHPYSISMAIENYLQIEKWSLEEKIAYFNRIDSDELLQTYLLDGMEKSEKNLLKLLSCCNFWDQEIFTYLIEIFNPGYSQMDFQFLCNHSFVQKFLRENCFTMHSLMRESLQVMIDPKVKAKVHEKMFSYYQNQLSAITIKAIDENSEIAFIESVYHGFKVFTDLNSTSSFIQWFMGIIAIFKQAAKWTFLIPVFEKLFQNPIQSLIKDDKLVVFLLNELGSLYRFMGRYKEALSIFMNSLNLSSQVLGLEHPDTLTSMNNLANLYDSMGQYDNALPLNTSALELRKKVLGPEHPDTLTSMNNLANLYDSIGQYEKALPFYTSALELRKKVLGPEHPDTLTSMNNLANLYYSLGHYEDSLPIYKETLILREKVLGLEHPNRLTTLSNLAILLCSMGKLEEALPYLQETLDLRKKILGSEHPDTLGTMNNLAILLCSMGKLEEALPYLQETLELRKRILGPEHPDTLGTMNNLANIYCSLNRLDDALPLIKETLLLRKKVLGPEHPSTLTSMNNYANLLHTIGSYKESEPIIKETIDLRKKVLGLEHPNTLTSMNNYANLKKDMGLKEDALNIYNDVLVLRKKVLGPEHPDTIETLNNLNDLLKKNSK